MGFKSFLASIKAGWEDWRVLMPARDDDDDDYNFTSGSRRGVHGTGYNFPAVRRRGAESDDDGEEEQGDHYPARSTSPASYSYSEKGRPRYSS